MAESVKLTIETDDKTAQGIARLMSNLDKLNAKGSEVGNIFKGILAADIFQKGAAFIMDSVKVAADYSPKVGKAIEGMSNKWRGFQVAVGEAILSNGDLMKGFDYFITTIAPRVVSAVKTIADIISVAARGWRMVGTMAAIAWKSLTGQDTAENWKAIGQLTADNDKSWASMGGNMLGVVDGTGPAIRSFKEKNPTGDKKARDQAIARAGMDDGRDARLTKGSRQAYDMAKYQADLSRRWSIFSDAIPIPDVGTFDENHKKLLDKRLFKGYQDAIIANWQENILPTLKQAFSDGIAGSIVDGFEAGITVAVESGSIGAGFKAMAGTMLKGFGSALIDFGKAVIAGSTLILALKKALSALNPAASLLAGIGMVALGSVLQGVASKAFGNMGNGAAASAIQNNSFNDAFGLKAAPTTLIIKGGAINLQDPRQQKELADALGTITGRKLQIQGA